MIAMIIEKIEPQPSCDIPGAYFDAYNGGPQWNWWDGNKVCNGHDIITCPFGKKGDSIEIVGVTLIIKRIAAMRSGNGERFWEWQVYAVEDKS